MEKSQKEYFLNEQIKAAQKELGDISDEKNELEELQKKIEETKLSKEALEKINSEFSKLKQMSPMSAEATVVRTYIDTLLEVPWSKRTKINLDLTKAKEAPKATAAAQAAAGWMLCLVQVLATVLASHHLPIIRVELLWIHFPPPNPNQIVTCQTDNS